MVTPLADPLARALLLMAEEQEAAGLHHQRKGSGNGTEKPKKLEDVYGSVWITAGAGSVVLLWGQAGDPIVELIHLKQPADTVGPLKVEHDHQAGRSTVYHGFDAVRFLRNRKTTGATVTETAKAWFEKDKPTDSERKRAQRRLEQLVTAGLATISQAGERGGYGGAQGAVYVATDVMDGVMDNAPAGQTMDEPRTSPRAEPVSPGRIMDGVMDVMDAGGHGRSIPPLEGDDRQTSDPLDDWDPTDGWTRR